MNNKIEWKKNKYSGDWEGFIVKKECVVKYYPKKDEFYFPSTTHVKPEIVCQIVNHRDELKSIAQDSRKLEDSPDEQTTSSK